MEKEEIAGAVIKWTRYWSDEEKKEVRPMLRDVFNEYVEFQEEEITLGRASSARGRRPMPKGRDKRKDRYYIQLNTESADRFTISHELQHILTREKAIDLRAIARSGQFFDREPGYLQIPEKVVENIEEEQERLQMLASAALMHTDDPEKPPPVKWFEQELERFYENQVKRTKTNNEV